MASKAERAQRRHRQAIVSKVVWGLLFVTMGTLFMLQNFGRIDLGGKWPHPASNAVDGDPNTRWSSAFSDPQWVTVDLGARAEITRLRLNWESAYAKRYAIEVSDDNQAWTTLKSVAKDAGGVDDFELAASGRYVRVRGQERATRFGYSLWELEVYGPGGLISRGKPTMVSSREGLSPLFLYWPLLMIGAGLPALLAPKDAGDQVTGLLLVAFGVSFLLQNLELVRWTLSQTWPLVFVGAGLLFVVQALRQMTRASQADDAGSGL